ncbi:MAG: cupin domain-containing protein [Pirellulales bacterium]|nr:cupin domain-containing protein [Pirellulales bacterium]
MSSDHPFGRPTELAALYVTGAMTPEERRRFDQHLTEGCAACAAALGRLDSVAKAFCPPPAPVEASSADPQGAAEVPVAQASQTAIQIVRASEAVWHDTPYDGVTMQVLHVDHSRGQYTALIRMLPGSVCSELRQEDRSQCYIIAGEMFIDIHHLRAGDFIYTGTGSLHHARAGEGGCVACLVEPLHRNPRW